MNKFLLITLFVAGFMMLASCGGNEQKGEKATDSISVVDPLNKNGIKLSEVSGSPAFPDAGIEITNPKMANLKPGKMNFEFKLENYTLGNQTQDAADKLCANSKQGQHIHFILNNGPYAALYEPKREAELEEGHYTLLSFLSRSYHESLKTKKAYAITQFIVGKPESVDTIITEDTDTDETFKTEVATFKNGKKQQVNLKLDSNPYLFYSRPKGTYTGADTKKVMLDFYLVNTDLSEQGNKVRVFIDSTEFIISKWAPYFIEGLSMGEHKISLTLIDKENNPVYEAAPYYESGERMIVLQEDEPVAGK